jgi:translation initiation factor 2B subunit (eIF-2B alpha/beta/delta family)
MDQWYDNMHKRAVDMQHHFHDKVDDHNHPTAHLLREEIRHLEDDIQSKKQPRSIENRIKTIQTQLLRSQHSGEAVFDPTSSVALHRQFEDLRREIRKAPHY